jgi:hypothetical protein
MTSIPVKELIWRVYLKYSRYVNGPSIKTSNPDRTKKYVKNVQRQKRKSTKYYHELKDFFHEEYHTKEKGIKMLAKEHCTTEMQMRGMLEFLEIGLRRGQNVVTNRLREFRREKAYKEHEQGIGWFDPNIRRKIEKYNARGVQGYFLNKSTNELVWLRSTYEYIFAKWLNRTEQKWKMEETHYKIGNSTYRPDFFIYDSTFTKLEKIVEIKGYWDNNSHKALELNEKLKDVRVSIIQDIERFIENNSTYLDQLAEWKQKRITNNG